MVAGQAGKRPAYVIGKGSGAFRPRPKSVNIPTSQQLGVWNQMWKPGQSGNPSGRPREKAFADMLRLALKDTDKDGKLKLRKIAEKLIECAINGEAWAIQQIGDRLDGRPQQEATVGALSQASAEDLREDS